MNSLLTEQTKSSIKYIFYCRVEDVIKGYTRGVDRWGIPWETRGKLATVFYCK